MNKLNGGSLFYALAISIIIGMLTGSVVLAQFYHRCILRTNSIHEEVVRNAESGVIYCCTVDAMNVEDDVDIDLFGRGKDSVLVQRKPWGAYDICVSTAHTGNITWKTIAMTGNIQEKEDAFALWLADMDRPLSITGSTQLNGKCFLPKAGVERSYIEGKSYSGRELVRGTIEPSSRFMPSYDTERMKGVTALFTTSASEFDSIVSWNEISSEEIIEQSFSGKRLIITSDLPIHLTSQQFTGQIVLRSIVSIIVSKEALLENIILIAPRIEIQKSVRGSFQAFARDSIIVGNDVDLGYPTVLGIIPLSGAIEKVAIVIGNSSKVCGELFLDCQTNDINHERNILLETESVIEGAINCYGSVDLKGSVLGSLCCQKITLRTNSAVYENHLMDAIIDCSQRSEFWLGSILFNKSETAHVIQWLN